MILRALLAMIVGPAILTVANVGMARASEAGQRMSPPTLNFYPEKLRGICNYVYGKIEDKTDPENWTFAYERQIYEAAGVDFKLDTADIARRKIRQMWDANQSRLRCNRGDFDVTNGSILKYAVAKRTFDFIDNAVSVWGVDVNQPDDSDGKTLLDYIDQKIAENLGNDLEPVLRSYVSKLVSFGAKRCRALSDTSKCR